MNVCLYSCLSYPTYSARLFLRIVILSCVACLAVPFIFTLYHKRHDFREKGVEHKICFSFHYNLCLKHFSFSEGYIETVL